MIPTALLAFLIVAMGSPGPNVIMLTTSGARFGVQRTWPHLLGVVLGVGFIGAASGLGIGAILQANPNLRIGLQVVSALWILWMAYDLLRGGKSGGTTETERPMRFVEAVLFQWVNPKIWAVALAASSGYGLGLPPLQEALTFGLSFSFVNFFVCVFWTFSGQILSRLLNSPRAWMTFRIVMATLLALSALLVFY